MKAVGIVRRIDDLGRIVIPKELRKVLGADTGTAMEFYTDDESIIIRKYSRGCCECGDSEIPLHGKSGICLPCASKLLGGKL